MNHKLARRLQILAIILTIMVVLLSAKAVPEIHESVEMPEDADMSESIETPESAEGRKEESQEEGVQKEARDIFADSAVVDLGNHKVAYLIASDELERHYGGYKDWIAVQKLDKGNDVYSSGWDTLFIPIEGTIIAIEPVDDFTGLRINGKAGQEVYDIELPVCFFPETDFIDLYQGSSRLIPSAKPETSSIPAEVWRETIGSGEEKYGLFFERISIPYRLVSDFKGGDFADYQLTVSDGEGKEVQKLILTCIFVSQEDTHWMIDMNGDGFRDLIFCADHVVGQRDSSTKLVFLVWNNDKKLYEEKPFKTKYATDSYLDGPIWNAKERALMVAEEKLGNYWVQGREMYRFVDGSWQLYARLIPSSDEVPPAGMNGYEKEKYYKELDYYYIEQRYASGEMIEETVMEEAPYKDRQSMWYSEREGNEALVPGGEFPGIPIG